jgi:anthranilate synthase component 1
MSYFPDFKTFTELAAGHTMVPVFRQLTSDTLTPVSAFCKVQEGEWSFLFESVVGGEKIGRYSFLGSGPFLKFQAWDHKVVIQEGCKNVREEEHPDPLKLLEEYLQRYRAPQVPGLPRFTGGAVGYAGYDAVRYTERLPNPPPDDRQLPDLSFAFYDRMVIFDQISKTIATVAHARVGPDIDLGSAYQAACQRVDVLVEKLQQNVADLQLTDIDAHGQVTKEWKSNFAPGAFEAAVVKCQEYIKAGDAFQVVLSQRLQAQTKARPFDIYRTLRIVNPSPFMFYLRAGNVTLVGSSPEIMVRVENDVITLRPLAGTRRRGATEEEDVRLAQELQADPKERAEHVMLVDLGRNDVGRVAQYASVELKDVLSVERYSHVMHLSSTVTGKLAPNETALSAMRAALPAGTLSGAPKVRAMEIIDELEPVRRGPYGGAVGYLDFSGNLDTCIALRTMVIKGQTAYIQAGAGIVYDSVPAEEYQETMNKAMGLLRAIEMAEEQL